MKYTRKRTKRRKSRKLKTRKRIHRKYKLVKGGKPFVLPANGIDFTELSNAYNIMYPQKTGTLENMLNSLTITNMSNAFVISSHLVYATMNTTPFHIIFKELIEISVIDSNLWKQSYINILKIIFAILTKFFISNLRFVQTGSHLSTFSDYMNYLALKTYISISSDTDYHHKALNHIFKFFENNGLNNIFEHIDTQKLYRIVFNFLNDTDTKSFMRDIGVDIETYIHMDILSNAATVYQVTVEGKISSNRFQ